MALESFIFSGKIFRKIHKKFIFKWDTFVRDMKTRFQMCFYMCTCGQRIAVRGIFASLMKLSAVSGAFALLMERLAVSGQLLARFASRFNSNFIA